MDRSLSPLALDPVGPTPQSFFRGETHWSNPPDADAALIEATEARLGIVLPDVMRALYLEQNGGGSDFAYSAKDPGASLTPADDAAFDADWRWTLPDYALLPLGEFIMMDVLQDGFDHDPDGSWRAHLPAADRLVRIGQQAWDVYLCLDYINGGANPAVVLFDDVLWQPGEGAPYQATWPDFATFFHGLRRHVLSEFDGLLYRGIRPAGPRDQPPPHAG